MANRAFVIHNSNETINSKLDSAKVDSLLYTDENRYKNSVLRVVGVEAENDKVRVFFKLNLTKALRKCKSAFIPTTTESGNYRWVSFNLVMDPTPELNAMQEQCAKTAIDPMTGVIISSYKNHSLELTKNSGNYHLLCDLNANGKLAVVYDDVEELSNNNQYFYKVSKVLVEGLKFIKVGISETSLAANLDEIANEITEVVTKAPETETKTSVSDDDW